MTLTFELIETATSPLWDFGWFDCSRFRITSPVEHAEPYDLLITFLRSPISQRSFCDLGPWGEPVGRRGPFLHGIAVASAFRSIDANELAREVGTVLCNPKFRPLPSPIQRHPVESWVERMRARGDAAFTLDLAHCSSHRIDFAWIWRVYHEFVCVSPAHDELTVAVIGYD